MMANVNEDTSTGDLSAATEKIKSPVKRSRWADASEDIESPIFEPVNSTDPSIPFVSLGPSSFLHDAPRKPFGIPFSGRGTTFGKRGTRTIDDNPIPPRNSVLVGNIERQASEETVAKFFPNLYLTYVSFLQSAKPLCEALVSFSSKEDVQKAIQYNNSKPEGNHRRAISVRYPIPALTPPLIDTPQQTRGHYIKQLPHVGGPPSILHEPDLKTGRSRLTLSGSDGFSSHSSSYRIGKSIGSDHFRSNDLDFSDIRSPISEPLPVPTASAESDRKASPTPLSKAPAKERQPLKLAKRSVTRPSDLQVVEGVSKSSIYGNASPIHDKVSSGEVFLPSANRGSETSSHFDTSMSSEAPVVGGRFRMGRDMNGLGGHQQLSSPSKEDFSSSSHSGTVRTFSSIETSIKATEPQPHSSLSTVKPPEAGRVKIDPYGGAKPIDIREIELKKEVKLPARAPSTPYSNRGERSDDLNGRHGGLHTLAASIGSQRTSPVLASVEAISSVSYTAKQSASLSLAASPLSPRHSSSKPQWRSSTSSNLRERPAFSRRNDKAPSFSRMDSNGGNASSNFPQGGSSLPLILPFAERQRNSMILPESSVPLGAEESASSSAPLVSSSETAEPKRSAWGEVAHYRTSPVISSTSAASSSGRSRVHISIKAVEAVSKSQKNSGSHPFLLEENQGAYPVYPEEASMNAFANVSSGSVYTSSVSGGLLSSHPSSSTNPSSSLAEQILHSSDKRDEEGIALKHLASPLPVEEAVPAILKKPEIKDGQNVWTVRKQESAVREAAAAAAVESAGLTEELSLPASKGAHEEVLLKSADAPLETSAAFGALSLHTSSREAVEEGESEKDYSAHGPKESNRHDLYSKASSSDAFRKDKNGGRNFREREGGRFGGRPSRMRRGTTQRGSSRRSYEDGGKYEKYGYRGTVDRGMSAKLGDTPRRNRVLQREEATTKPMENLNTSLNKQNFSTDKETIPSTSPQDQEKVPPSVNVERVNREDNLSNIPRRGKQRGGVPAYSYSRGSGSFQAKNDSFNGVNTRTQGYPHTPSTMTSASSAVNPGYDSAKSRNSKQVINSEKQAVATQNRFAALHIDDNGE